MGGLKFNSVATTAVIFPGPVASFSLFCLINFQEKEIETCLVIFLLLAWQPLCDEPSFIKCQLPRYYWIAEFNLDQSTFLQTNSTENIPLRNYYFAPDRTQLERRRVVLGLEINQINPYCRKNADQVV